MKNVSSKLVVVMLCLALFSACRSSKTVLVNYPTDIAYELVRQTDIRSWRLMPEAEAAPIIKKIRQQYVENGAWPDDVRQAEERHDARALSFEAGDFYAVFWLFSQMYEGRRFDYFFSICFKKQNFDEVLFSGGGNCNLQYVE